MHEKARRWRVVGTETAKKAVIFSESGEKCVTLKNAIQQLINKER